MIKMNLFIIFINYDQSGRGKDLVHWM